MTSQLRIFTFWGSDEATRLTRELNPSCKVLFGLGCIDLFIRAES